jgi:hypothetical protein
MTTLTTTTQPRQIPVIDGVTGGSASFPETALAWSRRSHMHCPRCNGRLFVSRSLSADGGHWVTNCINCGYERDIL